MFKLLKINNWKKQWLYLPAIAVLGLGLGIVTSDPASAELTPELQDQVNQILAAGGPDVVINLSNLSQANPDAAADILIAGIFAGVECQGLSISISEFTDDDTDEELQDIVDTTCDDDMDEEETSTEAGDTSENPNQTSGSETTGG